MSKVLVIIKTGEEVPMPRELPNCALEEAVISRGLAKPETVATQFGYGHGAVFVKHGIGWRMLGYTKDVEVEKP